MSNKQEVKTIQVKEGIVWVSPLEQPIEQSEKLFSGDQWKEANARDSFNKALKLFSESMVRVENPEILDAIMYAPKDRIKEQFLETPAGLLMEVKLVSAPCPDAKAYTEKGMSCLVNHSQKVAICSFQNRDI